MEPDVIMAPCCEAMQDNDAGLQYDGDSVAGANVRTGASGPRLACECGPERRVHFEAACRPATALAMVSTETWTAFSLGTVLRAFEIDQCSAIVRVER